MSEPQSPWHPWIRSADVSPPMDRWFLAVGDGPNWGHCCFICMYENGSYYSMPESHKVERPYFWQELDELPDMKWIEK